MLPNKRYLAPDFSDFFNNFGKLTNWDDERLLASRLDIDVEDRPDSYEIKANLPEVKKEAVNVSVDGNTLTISVSDEQEHEQVDRKFVLKERRSSYSARSIVLPAELSTEDVSATLRDGVLTLSIKKHPTKQVKKVAIN